MSKFYSMLGKRRDKGLPTLWSAWEVDLGMAFTDQEWKMILQNIKTMSRELKTRLVQFKLMHRIYWSPHRLHRANFTQSPKFCPCQAETGTLIHMLWNCTDVQHFWYRIYKYDKLIIQKEIQFSPRLFILGDPSLKHLLSNTAEWVQTVLMVGHKLIISQWKATSAPPYGIIN